MATETRLPERYADPRPIGRGGMGEIFLAEDQVLGRKVAVKLLEHRFARDEQLRARFTREALTAARLSAHPHIVTIFDVGECDGRPFIVMEYLPGGTVAERARTGRVSQDDALAWLDDTASALDEAHAAGVVHRDVKPANLLLDERGGVHVGDFGIARVVDETSGGMTLAGTVLGTAGYLSPEQARGEPATAASDVYALGVVAYELLTGGRPFEGGSSTEEAAAHIHQPVPPASERGVDLPRDVDAVFERVLAKQPEERYGHAAEFVAALGEALRPPVEPTTRIFPPAGGARGRPRRRRHWTPVVVSALVLGAIAAAGVLAAVLTSGDGDAQQATPKVTAKTVTRITTTQGEPTTVEVPTTVTQATTATTATATTSETQPSGGGGGKVSRDEAVQLTDQATGLMRDGNYADALPLALRAYRSLRGSGELYEAYSAFDAGKSYIELGRCEQGLPLLDESERIQGPKQPISKARAQCG